MKGGWQTKTKSLKKQSGGWEGVKPIKTKVQVGGNWPVEQANLN